jgi:hypothetical protein
MATANQVITDAYQEILVQADEQSMSDANMQAAIRTLNRLMLKWDVSGMPLGFTIITNVSDTVTVSDGALDAIVANLAVRLAPQFDRNVSIELAAAARSGMKSIEFISVTIAPTPRPDNLSIGSGNESWPYVDHFYNEEQDNELLTENNNGSITLESETE